MAALWWWWCWRWWSAYMDPSLRQCTFASKSGVSRRGTLERVPLEVQIARRAAHDGALSFKSRYHIRARNKKLRPIKPNNDLRFDSATSYPNTYVHTYIHPCPTTSYYHRYCEMRIVRWVEFLSAAGVSFAFYCFVAVGTSFPGCRSFVQAWTTPTPTTIPPKHSSLSTSLSNRVSAIPFSKHQRPSSSSRIFPGPSRTSGDCSLVILRGGRRPEGQPVLPQQQSSQVLSGKGLIVGTAIALLTSCVLAAVTGLLPGYLNVGNGGGGNVFSAVQKEMLLQDVGATLLTGILGYAFVQVNTWAVSMSLLEARDARKLIHTFSAPLFILFWPLFSSNPSARCFAALVPTLNAVRLFIAASSTPTTASTTSVVGDKDNNDSSTTSFSSWNSESALAAAVSRSGDAKEALGGPFIYVIVLATSILIFWRDSPVGIVALSALAAGDGMADLVGRRLGANNKWPNSSKSVAGSIAFWISSTATATGLVAWMQYTECLALPIALPQVAMIVAGITLVSAILEVVPWLGDDNYSVPLSAAILSALFLHA